MYFIVESWLSDQDKKKIGDLEENGYRVEHTLWEDKERWWNYLSFQKRTKCKENHPPFCD